MKVHDPEFTHDEYVVLIEALERWKELGTSESAVQRKEQVALIKAKLLLQRHEAVVDAFFDRTFGL